MSDTKIHLPRTRPGHTFTFRIGGEGLHLFVRTGEYPEGKLREVFVTVSKHGSTLGGWADAFSIAFSGGLQHAVVPEDYLRWCVENMTGLTFEPHGQTDDEEVGTSTSAVDFIVRKLASIYLSKDSSGSDLS